MDLQTGEDALSDIFCFNPSSLGTSRKEEGDEGKPFWCGLTLFLSLGLFLLLSLKVMDLEKTIETVRQSGESVEDLEKRLEMLVPYTSSHFASVQDIHFLLLPLLSFLLFVTIVGTVMDMDTE